MEASADHCGRKAEPTTRHVETARSQPQSLLGIEHETPSINAKPISAAAILTAVGIVYGDLGTSPLYVFPAIAKSSGGSLDEATALGSMSLAPRRELERDPTAFWSALGEEPGGPARIRLARGANNRRI
jgi:hypothetical protein